MDGKVSILLVSDRKHLLGPNCHMIANGTDIIQDNDRSKIKQLKVKRGLINSCKGYFLIKQPLCNVRLISK